jgi:hypothetical protein
MMHGKLFSSNLMGPQNDDDDSKFNKLVLADPNANP